jgi:hypothetical protein
MEWLPGEGGDPLLVSGHGFAALLAAQRIPEHEVARLVAGDEAAPVRRPGNRQDPVSVALNVCRCVINKYFLLYQRSPHIPTGFNANPDSAFFLNTNSGSKSTRILAIRIPIQVETS